MSQINEVVTKAKLGDVESMEHILQIFKPKVTAICREYFLCGADFDDLLSVFCAIISFFYAILFLV